MTPVDEIRKLQAEIDHMNAEQEKWRRDSERADVRLKIEAWRVALYAILVLAATMAAGAALWELAVRAAG